MSTTIEQLELEVQSNASSAVSGIDALTSSLDKLKNATKGGCGLNSVSKQFATLNTALNNISQANIKKMSYLGQALKTLSSASNFKLSSSIATQVTNIGVAVRSLSGTNFSSLNSLTSALTPLSTIGKSNLNSFISQLQRLPQAVLSLNSVDINGLSIKLTELASAFSSLSHMGKNNLTSFISSLSKLPQVMADLKSVNISELTSQIKQLANAFAPLATQMSAISRGFAAFPARIQTLITSTNNLATSNNRATTSYINLAARAGTTFVIMRQLARVLANMMYEGTEWDGIATRFGRAFGDSAEEAYDWIEQLNSKLGISTQEFMQYSSIFGTMLKGYGVTSEDAAKMAMGYTELAYDIWAGYNDIYTSFEDAATAVRSAISGEVEPIRRAGFTIVDSQLKITAANYGIAYSSQSASEELKSYLRYLTLVGQADEQGLIGTYAKELTTAEGLLRTLRQQLKSLAQTIGGLFLPILVKVLPYLQAFISLLTDAIRAVAQFFGITIQKITFDKSLSSGATAAEDLSDTIADAEKNSKKLKNALLGIDELNVLSQSDDSSGSSSSSGSAGSGGALDVDSLWDNSILDSVNQQVEELKEKLKGVLPIVAAIGMGFAAWKIAGSVMNFLNMLSNVKGFSMPAGLLGFIMLIADLKKFSEYLEDIIANGKSLSNVSGLIAEAIGAIGDAFIVFGGIKIGGVLKIVQGVGEIFSAFADIADNDVDFDNLSTLFRGISNIIIGIGLVSGTWEAVGIGVAIQGVTGFISELGNIMDAIETGNWENVDKVTLAISAVEVVGGLAVAIATFSNRIKTTSMTEAGGKVAEVATATETLDTTISTSLSPKLTSLAKNLAMGIVIVAEVAVAAGLIVGSIILLGEGLAQVGESWQPVIDNASTVAIAVGIGTAALVAIGAATALIGTVGKPLIVKMALGTAILAELGIATALFLVEVWGIGKGLDEIGQAWQPVLDNGETIATGIEIGTALLVGIGAVTALLGVATVATAGALPLAIGLGTAILVELAAAFVLFTESLVAVADELSQNLAPSLEELNDELPSLSDNMSDFVDFMTEFAEQVVRYTEVSAISGISATVDTIVGWFTEDPIDKLADDVSKIHEQVSGLNDKLEVANPELASSVALLTSYRTFLSQLETLTNDEVNLSNGVFVNMNEIGKNLVTGFVDGIKSKSTDFSNAAQTLVNGFKTSLTNSVNACKTSIVTWASNIKTWFTSSSYGAINGTTFNGYAKSIIVGFCVGILNNYTTAKSSITVFASHIKNTFNGIVSYSTFYNIAKDVVDGFNNGINNFYKTTEPYMTRWANDAAITYKAALDSNSPSKRFMHIGEDTVRGYNIGIANLADTTKGVVTDWANSFSSVNPTMSFAVDTSALKYYNSESFANAVSADVSSKTTVTATGFKEGMEEFYKEYVEPVISQMASDVRRQADKNEQTIVKVGNRTVTDAVNIQQKANGYVFAR